MKDDYGNKWQGVEYAMFAFILCVFLFIIGGVVWIYLIALSIFTMKNYLPVTIGLMSLIVFGTIFILYRMKKRR